MRWGRGALSSLGNESHSGSEPYRHWEVFYGTDDFSRFLAFIHGRDHFAVNIVVVTAYLDPLSEIVSYLQEQCSSYLRFLIRTFQFCRIYFIVVSMYVQWTVVNH